MRRRTSSKSCLLQGFRNRLLPIIRIRIRANAGTDCKCRKSRRSRARLLSSSNGLSYYFLATPDGDVIFLYNAREHNEKKAEHIPLKLIPIAFKKEDKWHFLFYAKIFKVHLNLNVLRVA